MELLSALWNLSLAFFIRSASEIYCHMCSGFYRNTKKYKEIQRNIKKYLLGHKLLFAFLPFSLMSVAMPIPAAADSGKKGGSVNMASGGAAMNV